MNKTIILTLFLSALLFWGCEKETILSVDQTSITIPDVGGTQILSLTTNKPWTASSNQSWCKVSPSTGDEASNSKITLTCEPNKTYDARNGSVTFTCSEKTVVVNVSQATNNGLHISQNEYVVTSAAQQLEIKVQANVNFNVEVDNGCKTWVKYNSTKGLSSSTVILDIAKNEAYDGREGKVTIKQVDGNLSTTVVIKQEQLDGLFLTTNEYNLPKEEQTLTIDVSSNIEFEVKPEVDWIQYIETKGLSNCHVLLLIQKNSTGKTRSGVVRIKQKNGELDQCITIKQQGEISNVNVRKFITIEYDRYGGVWRDTTNIEYDEEGRVVIFGNVSIYYSDLDANTVIGRTEELVWADETATTLKKETTEMKIINNLCVSTQSNYDFSAINQYDNNKIKQIDWFGWYPKTYTYTWREDNLVSWSSGQNSVTSFDYYDYENPWQNSFFDITSAFSYHTDMDDYSLEWILGFNGVHSKNLLKASYGNWVLYDTLEYEFDAMGRITKITDRVKRKYQDDLAERKTVYELYY